jgi:hypothetical protein
MARGWRGQPSHLFSFAGLERSEVTGGDNNLDRSTLRFVTECPPIPMAIASERVRHSRKVRVLPSQASVAPPISMEAGLQDATQAPNSKREVALLVAPKPPSPTPRTARAANSPTDRAASRRRQRERHVAQGSTQRFAHHLRAQPVRCLRLLGSAVGSADETPHGRYNRLNSSILLEPRAPFCKVRAL